MTDQKRRGTLRMLFLVICVLPTSIVLVTVFGSGLLADTHGARFGNHQNAVSPGIRNPSGLPPHLGDDSRDETRKWLDEIGIRSDDRGINQSMVASISSSVSFEDLVADHPLRLLSIPELEVARTNGETQFSVSDCVLSRAELLDFAKSFVAGKWVAILNKKRVVVQFDRVILTEQGDASSRQLFLRDVKIQFDCKNPSLVSITGRQRDSVAIYSAEKPFRASFSKSASEFSFTCTANRLPVWVFGNAVSKMAGETAMFRGSFQLDMDSTNADNSSRFVGEFDGVSAATLSGGAVIGSANVSAKECRFVNGRLEAFNGTVFSSSSGTVNKSLFHLYSDQFRVAPGNGLDFYRSFGADIGLENGKLRIKSLDGYQNQIVWGATQNANASSPIVSSIHSVVGPSNDGLNGRQPLKNNVTFRIVDVQPVGAMVDVGDYLDRFFLGD